MSAGLPVFVEKPAWDADACPEGITASEAQEFVGGPRQIISPYENIGHPLHGLNVRRYALYKQAAGVPPVFGGVCVVEWVGNATYDALDLDLDADENMVFLAMALCRESLSDDTSVFLRANNLSATLVAHKASLESWVAATAPEDVNFAVDCLISLGESEGLDTTVSVCQAVETIRKLLQS